MERRHRKSDAGKNVEEKCSFCVYLLIEDEDENWSKK